MTGSKFVKDQTEGNRPSSDGNVGLDSGNPSLQNDPGPTTSVEQSGEDRKTARAKANEQLISQLYADQCASEPIHLLGEVQPHGYLTVIDLNTDCFCQISAGVTRHYPGVKDARDLLEQPAREWIRPEQGTLSEVIETLRSDLRKELHLQRRKAGPSEIEWETGSETECTGYRFANYAVLEWQPAQFDMVKIVQQYKAMNEFTDLISDSSDFVQVKAYLRDASSRLQTLSGYERVMVYRFLPDWSGEILAEATASGVDQRFLGQRFPATDIPPQARALYLSNRLRILGDVDAEADSLIPQHLPCGKTLDQSTGLLRSMSEAHLCYLKNMGVQATLTLSIVIDEELWGMIACHHSKPLVPPNQVIQGMRSSAKLLSTVISTRVAELKQLEFDARLESLEDNLQRFYDDLSSNQQLKHSIKNHETALCNSMAAANIGLLTGRVLHTSFDLEPESKRRLGRKLWDIANTIGADDLFSLETLPDSLQGKNDLPCESAGLLLARLSEKNNDCIFWLRNEIITEVHWAGKPDKFTIADDDTGLKLEPRRSFEIWKEERRGRCELWTPVDQLLAKAAAKRVNNMLHELTSERLRQHLDWSATHDTLTSLLNRNALLGVLHNRLKQGPTAIAIIDLDNFQRINDIGGNDVGDMVLKQIAARLTAHTRDKEEVGRIGSDEFILIYPLQAALDCADKIEAMAESLLDLIRQPFTHGTNTLNLNASIGLAVSPDHGTKAQQLFNRADIALFEAKKMGGGQCTLYIEGMEETFRQKVEIEQDLIEAIKSDQFVLYYQPQIDLATGQVIGCEALIRWQHPTRGLVMPDFFLPVAEEKGLMRAIGKWVINESARQAAAWNQSIGPDFSIAFNASFTQLREPEIITVIKQAIESHGVDPANLSIELTESSILDDEETCVAVTSELSELGMQIALDDFGTGYSSLSHIHRLKMDCIKIDRSFIMQVERDQHARAVVESLLTMARSLHLEIVAEGVDNEIQAAWLRDAGCEFGQGFFWSPAVSAEEFPSVVDQINREAQ